MGAKTLPIHGEQFLGDVPSAMKILKIAFGVNSSDYDVDVTVTTSAAAAFPIAYVPDGIIIHELIAEKKVAFASTGAFTLNIGTATDPDALMESTGLVASDVGVFSSKQTTNLTLAGYIPHSSDIGAASDMDSDSKVAIVATIGTAKVSAGMINFYLVYSMAASQ